MRELRYRRTCRAAGIGLTMAGVCQQSPDKSQLPSSIYATVDSAIIVTPGSVSPEATMPPAFDGRSGLPRSRA